jgi:hypothetical protein
VQIMFYPETWSGILGWELLFDLCSSSSQHLKAFGRSRSLQLQHIRKKYSAKRANYFLLEDVFSIIILNPGIKFKT